MREGGEKYLNKLQENILDDTAKVGRDTPSNASSNTDATTSAITSTTYAIFLSSNGHIFGVGAVAACTPAKSTKYY